MKSDEIFDKVCDVLIERKITLYKLAKMTGLANTYNYNWLRQRLHERGVTGSLPLKIKTTKEPSINLNTLIAICDVLELDIIVSPKKKKNNGTEKK